MLGNKLRKVTQIRNKWQIDDSYNLFYLFLSNDTQTNVFFKKIYPTSWLITCYRIPKWIETIPL